MNDRLLTIARSIDAPVLSGRVVHAYPLSPMQQGMLYHWLRDPQGGVDLEHITCTLESVDIPTFTR